MTPLQQAVVLVERRGSQELVYDKSSVQFELICQEKRRYVDVGVFFGVKIEGGFISF